MNKWAYFTIGIMSGVIFILSFFLIAQLNENNVYANTNTASFAGGTEIIAQQGGSGQELRDIVWIVYRRPGKSPAAAGGGTTAGSTDERITLAAYKVAQGSRGKVELISVRDVSYDMQIVSYQTEPKVQEIKRKLEEEEAKRKEKKGR